MSASLSIPRPVRPDNPHRYWRTLCWVTENIALSGDLPAGTADALAQLEYWEAEGITHEIDLRVEAHDGDFVTANSNITYIHRGVDDNGGRRDDAWFDETVGDIVGILAADPCARIVVHCHLGVNRAPSMVFASLLEMGWEPLPALRRIREVRPIAGIIYATDAVVWHGVRSGLDHEEIAANVERVRRWFSRNNLDLSWIIRSLHRRHA